MSRIILVQHPRGQIWNILPGIAFASDVNLVSLHAECLDESLPEIIELV